MKLINLIFVLFVILVSVWAEDNVTPSVQCAGQNFDNLRERIHVYPCGKNKCKLRKGTNTTVHFVFNPPREVKNLTNEVYAVIGGIPLPFVGVTGKTACDHITHAEDDSSASCPLEAGKEYKYVNQFFIEDFYPQTNLDVHWSLNDGKNNVICFEVPAVIVPAKKN